MGAVQRLIRRREAEIARYDTYEKYPGIMRLWRQDILRAWLEGRGRGTYIDIGCGKGESLSIAHSLGHKARGCEVVEHLCARSDVDLVPGAHDLSRYEPRQFDYVTCLDVLEHVLPDDTAAALIEIGRVARVGVLLGISMKPGQWHPNIRTEDEWQALVRSYIGDCHVVYADMVPKVKQPYVWLEA